MDKRDQLLQASEIVSHASCPDGTGAAMICTAAYLSIGIDPPAVKFMHYGSDQYEKMVPMPRQIFVDIAPPINRKEEWKDKEPIVLDHHETMKENIIAFGGEFGGPDESGSTLAFNHVMVPLVLGKMPEDKLAVWRRFANLCMIRDTWKTDSPEWETSCALAYALTTYGQKHMLELVRSHKVQISALLPIGKIIHDQVQRQAWHMSKTAICYDVKLKDKEVRVAFFNHVGGGKMGDVAEYFLKRTPCDVVFGYFYLCDNSTMQCMLSIRTNGCVSASALAESFGNGGGHAKAAGFILAGDAAPEKIASVIMQKMIELFGQ